MNMNFLKPVYCEEAGAGGAGAGGNGDGSGDGSAEPTVAELAAQVEALAAEKAALLSKNQELLGETKAAKEARRQIEEAARMDAENKARGANDFEQLYKSSEESRLALQQEHEQLRTGIENERRNNEAMRIAVTMSEGDNAELLSEHIAKRLKVMDGELKVTDEKGNLTVSTVEQLATEFQNNARFKALLKGSQATGGGAAGGSKGGSAAKVMTRAEHEALSPVARSEFFRDGGKLTD